MRVEHGRPLIGDAPKSERIGLYLAPSERGLLRRAAGEQALAAWARDALNATVDASGAAPRALADVDERRTYCLKLNLEPSEVARLRAMPGRGEWESLAALARRILVNAAAS